MALTATTFTTYEAVGQREELHDHISNIDPTDTPFLTAIGTLALNSRHPEWQQDTLATASSTNYQLEGDNPAYPAVTPTTRLGNYSQIAYKAFLISDTEEVVNKAGRDSEVSYQASKKGLELKRDIELGMCGNQSSIAGTDAASVRKSASLEAWVTTNGSRDAAGADGGYVATTGLVAAATDSTTTRSLTEEMFQEALQNCWDNGGNPTLVLASSGKKRAISKFNNSSTITVFDENGDNTRQVSFDVYRHDFGTVRIVPSRWQRARTLSIIDPRFWSMGWLRPITMKEIAATGDAHRRFLRCEYSLVARNQKSSATIADLT